MGIFCTPFFNEKDEENNFIYYGYDVHYNRKITKRTNVWKFQ